MNESKNAAVNNLYNKYASTKADSRLTSYIKANTKLKINKMYKRSNPYPQVSTKGKSFMESLVASPVNGGRFTLKEVPTFEIVNQMEKTVINESKSLDITANSKAKRPTIVDSSYKPLEDFIIEAERFKREIQPLLNQPCIYQGRFDDGKKSGKGDFLYPNKDFYRGNFDRDSREGFGMMVSFSKSFVYKGEFKNDQIKGLGICILSNGMIIEGYFSGEESITNDTDVKCLYCNGELYEGRWKFNKRHGKGRHIYLDFSIYEGDWLNDKRNGTGKFTYADGTFIQGEFKKDKMVNGSKLIDANRNVYEPVVNSQNPGRFIRGRLYGQGKISFINGDTVLHFV